MSFGSTLVAIVAIIAFVVLRSVKYRAEGGRHAHSDLPPPREEELQREILDLKKRLAVLERIATDDRQSQAIAHEIESLRDR